MTDLSLLDAVLMVGLSARVTRLIVTDSIGIVFRVPVFVGYQTLLGKDRGARFAEGLLTCPFCIGFWISGAVLLSWVQFGHTLVWQLAAGVFTLNYIQAHMNRLADGD